jgi:hypothetical protein
MRSKFLIVAAALAVVSANAFAAPFGSTFRKVAEQLGLQIEKAPDQMPLNTPLTMTVVSPEKLAKQGLTGLKEGQEVQVTLLDGNQLRVVPMEKVAAGAGGGPTMSLRNSSLLLSMDAKGSISGAHVVPIDARLPAGAAIQIRH